MFSSPPSCILSACTITAQERVIEDCKSNTRKTEWEKLTLEEKRHRLYLRQKELLDTFLAHGAITRAS